MNPNPAPTLEEARQSVTAHATTRGEEVRRKYGPRIGWRELQAILVDAECVRYPCSLAFDATNLEPGECAFPMPQGDKPEDGFVLCVHPFFSIEPDRVPLLALYQLVAVNYGAFAAPADAEAFGAAALGMPVEDYYQALCAMADEIAVDGGEPEATALVGAGSGGCSGSCSCGSGGSGGTCGA